MLTCQRHLFSLPEGLHYLNCASRAPLLKAAEAAGMAGLQWQRAPEAIAPEAYFRAGEELRGQLGRLVNAPPDAIALVPSVSYGVAIAAHRQLLERGQTVVLPAGEFPSDVYAWMARCAETGAELRLVERPVEPPQTAARPGRDWSARLLEAIDRRTAVVHLSTVCWTDGVRFDLPAIAARAREVGALLVVDGTQTVGAAPFDFQALAPDLLVCSGYKWLLGPYQIGFAAVGERLREAAPLEHHWSNRAGSADVSAMAYRTEFRAGARRFDVGQHANPITVPMLSAGVRQVLEWGVEAIADTCAALLRPLDALAAECGGQGIRLAPAGERVAHIAGLHVADAAARARIAEALRQRNVRISLRGASVRISPHVYNTPADVEAFCTAFAEALR